MSLPVSLDELAGELEILTHETAVFVNHKTGEIAMVLLSDLGIVEEGRESEEELEWGEDSVPLLRSIAESEDWLALPDKFDIHEWEIMRDFAVSKSPHLAAELLDAIHGRGAFRMFKDVIHRHGIEEEWFEFKRLAFRRIAAEALEDAGIPYR